MASRFISRSSKLQLARRNNARWDRLGGDDREPVVLQLMEFEITDEPMPDAHLRRLDLRDQERIDEAGCKVMEGAADQVPILEKLVEEFESIPVIYNFLAVAYQNAGQQRKAMEWIERTYRRFPDYLFGVVNYAGHLLREGRVEEVTALLGNRFGLHLWIRGRRRYHVSEFVGFHSLMAIYFSTLGKDEQADCYVNMLLEVAPDHPQTRMAVDFVSSSFIRRKLGHWLGKYEARQRKRAERKAATV